MHSFTSKHAASLPSDASPLESVNKAQEQALELTRHLKIVLGFSLIALMLIFAHFLNPHGGIITGIGALSCLTLVALIFRAIKRLFALRLILGELYILHREKKHQTCGSMEPEKTRAR